MSNFSNAIREFKISGFRSLHNLSYDVSDQVNLFAGLNDHGKSNIFRALHLFFTGTVEPNVLLDYERDICKIGQKASKRITIEVGLVKTLAHEKLFESIGRKGIQSTEEFAVRRVWTRQAGGYSLRTDLVVYRKGQSGKRVYTDGEIRKTAAEHVILPKNQARFREEIDRLFGRFKIRYLPSSSTGALFEDAGLATEVKKYLFDSYAQSQSFRALGQALRGFRDQFEEMISTEFGDHLAMNLTAIFPGLESAKLQLPEGDADLIQTGDLHVHRNGKPISIASCGSGLQSVLVLETLKFLDSRIKPRGKDLTPVVIWLIEEPEAFLYEDLVHAVGQSLSEASRQFNLFTTTHSRELVYSVEGTVSWVELNESKGSHITKTISLDTDQEREEFSKYASQRFGQSWIEIQYERAAIAAQEADSSHPLIIVEGRTDKVILEKLFELDSYSRKVEILEAITNNSSNAEHVCKTVLKLRPLVEGRKIIGLFDNDIEGMKYFSQLKKALEESPTNQCHAAKLPCPEKLKEAQIGILDKQGKVSDTGQKENLEGVGITIEALFDSPDLEKFLTDKMYIESHWLSRRGSKATEVHYTRLTKNGENSKTRLAEEVANMLTKENWGSLAQLREDLGTLLDIEVGASE